MSELFDQNILRQLRCEAGGIKTVLRNSHQIFKGEFLEVYMSREGSEGTSFLGYKKVTQNVQIFYIL